MQTFQVKPCKEIGIIKNAIREAILEGIIRNTFDEAYQFMLVEGQKTGLQPKLILKHSITDSDSI